METALDAVRIHGGYGYSTEFDVERYFRDAALMIVGEGTNEIDEPTNDLDLGGLELVERFVADTRTVRARIPPSAT